MIYERGTINGLCLWPHTSVNLDELFARAVEATCGKDDGIKRLCDHVRCEHLVPRAFYARTGTLRYAEVKLIPVTGLNDLLANQPQIDGVGADLNLRVILPVDRAQQRNAIQILHERNRQLRQRVFRNCGRTARFGAAGSHRLGCLGMGNEKHTTAFGRPLCSRRGFSPD